MPLSEEMRVDQTVRDRRARLFGWSIVIAGLVLVAPRALATEQDGSAAAVSLPRTEVRFLSSGNGIEYKLYVSLPTSYARGEGKRYPVVVLLDADYSFGIARTSRST